MVAVGVNQTTLESNVPPVQTSPVYDYISEEDKQFLQGYLSFHDEERALRKHIMKITTQCRVPLTRLTMHCNPIYPKVLRIAIKDQKAIFLDVGTGYGHNIRKLVCDGFTASNVVAVDSREELWKEGYSLMKDDHEMFPVNFLQGDIFTLTEGENFPHKFLDLSAITSLVPLKGILSVIHLYEAFADLEEQLQRELAKRCAQLLSSQNDSVIFGEEPWDGRSEGLSKSSGYLHSKESFENLWKETFGDINIDFRAELFHKNTGNSTQNGRISDDSSMLFTWSVRVL